MWELWKPVSNSEICSNQASVQLRKQFTQNNRKFCGVFGNFCPTLSMAQLVRSRGNTEFCQFHPSGKEWHLFTIFWPVCALPKGMAPISLTLSSAHNGSMVWIWGWELQKKGIFKSCENLDSPRCLGVRHHRQRNTMKHLRSEKTEWRYLGK